MRRSTAYLVVALVAAAIAVHAQAQPGEYAGRKMCLMCHLQDHPEIVQSFPKTGHPSALLRASDETVKADFANAPFPREQVKYVLGSGIGGQAYLDAEWKTLPGEWHVATKSWETIPVVDAKVECVGCHVTEYKPDTGRWKENGVGCEMCHGPGAVHSTTLDPEQREGTILNPGSLDTKQVSMICGRCHSRGREKGGAFPFATAFLPGGDLTELFDDSQPDQPGMNQQFSDLIRSPKHWDNEVGCITCHDPHGTTGLEHQLRMPVTQLCLMCHEDKIKSLEEHVKDKGVTAPEGATCATCHMPDGRHLFDKTVAAQTAVH